MKNFVLVSALAAVTLGIACRSATDACKDNIVASRNKFHECTPDAGGFGEFFELAFAIAEAECQNVGKGCQKPNDAGTGTFNAAQADKCTAELKAATCTASSTSSTTCTTVCQ